MRWKVEFHDGFVQEYELLPEEAQDELTGHYPGS